MLWKRGLAVFLLAWAIALAIASLSSIEWVDNTDTQGQVNGSKYYLGLRRWKRTEAAPLLDLDSSEHDYDNGQFPSVFLGSSSSWKQAGMAALALGAIGVAFELIAFFAGIVDLATKNVSKVVPALTSFLAGFCIVLGAIIYEGSRPSFHGDMGYNWPVGIYLTSSCCSAIAAILYWSSDKKY